MSEVRRRKKGLEGFGFSIPEALKEAKDQMDRALEPVPSPGPDVIVSIVPAIKSDASPALASDNLTAKTPATLGATSPATLPDKTADSSTQSSTQSSRRTPVLAPVLAGTVSAVVAGEVAPAVAGTVAGEVASSVAPEIPPSQPVSYDPKNEGHILTKHQLTVYLYLLNNGSPGFTTHPDICSATNIKYPTVRKIIKNLMSLKLINYNHYHQGARQGLTYELDLRYRLEQKGRVALLRYDPEYHPEYQAEYHPKYQAQCQPPLFPYSSSSFFKKTTTTKTGDPPGTAPDATTEEQAIEQFLQTDPELGYWRDKGLTLKQIQQWMKLSNTSAADIFQSLCHCRFEMVDLDLETSKPVENVFNWFYRMIERVGYYPAPKGYKSFRQRQIERERLLLDERAKEIRDLQEIRQNKYEQELELAFQEMMNDQGGELFKICLCRIPPMAKEISRGKLFESTMKVAFEEYTQEKERETLAKATCQQLQ